MNYLIHGKQYMFSKKCDQFTNLNKHHYKLAIWDRNESLIFNNDLLKKWQCGLCTRISRQKA